MAQASATPRPDGRPAVGGAGRRHGPAYDGRSRLAHRRGFVTRELAPGKDEFSGTLLIDEQFRYYELVQAIRRIQPLNISS